MNEECRGIFWGVVCLRHARYFEYVAIFGRDGNGKKKLGLWNDILYEVMKVQVVCACGWTLNITLIVHSIKQLCFVSTKYFHCWWRGRVVSHGPRGVLNLPVDGEHKVRKRAFCHSRHDIREGHGCCGH